MTDDRTLFLLGGTGFIGQEVIKEARAAGWTVRALARSETSKKTLAASGAEPVEGVVDDPAGWLDAARGTRALIDPGQPQLPKRLTGPAVRRISSQRPGHTPP